MRKILFLLTDILGAALLTLAVYLIGYKLPGAGVSAPPLQSSSQVTAATQPAVTAGNASDPSATEEARGQSTTGQNTIDQNLTGQNTAGQSATDQNSIGQNLNGQSSAGQNTTGQNSLSVSRGNWKEKFADHFTDEIVATDTSYTSPNLSITLTYGSYDSGKSDTSEGGKHLKYGTKISYVLADIYVADITCLQTAFAKDRYGVGFEEKLTDMSSRMQAVLAVNGDSYSNNRHRNSGTIIRNGVLYRAETTDMETCVLNWDGSLQIYGPGETDAQTLMDNGAYQSWIFGPSLLDENGKAKMDFTTWDYIRESHPRTAIGYYEPGHYCLLVVDGRQSSSRGMFLGEMADLFESLGCSIAYNLDGGHCSFMTYRDTVANQPYKAEKTISDGIFFTEGLTQ